MAEHTPVYPQDRFVPLSLPMKGALDERGFFAPDRDQLALELLLDRVRLSSPRMPAFPEGPKAVFPALRMLTAVLTSACQGEVEELRLFTIAVRSGPYFRGSRDTPKLSKLLAAFPLFFRSLALQTTSFTSVARMPVLAQAWRIAPAGLPIPRPPDNKSPS
ncbi:hypothetical protein J2Z31_001831 [Sinorhizobium kostiense]|uniref:Transposase n=1 Tax=Sinorhizobium kostiense TaxID=76747 RepID=A0ABS4QXY0_9HYPH|nr:hypothetical protein [Sinorhizobium kostiense]MBP2235339.1 hypothetical protein [Sinorhizobium kostiense]